jgi:hypothetical protein
VTLITFVCNLQFGGREPHTKGTKVAKEKQKLDFPYLCDLGAQPTVWAAGTAALLTFGIFSLIHRDFARFNALCLGQSQG